MEYWFETIYTWFGNHAATPLRVVLILVLSTAALRAIHRLIPRLREFIATRQESREDSQRIRTLSRVIRYFLNLAVLIIAGISILSEFGVAVAPILGAAGVAGIAVGFGAQSLVKDCFTGFFLLLENQIRIGDVVEAGGKSGVVEELTLRYLRLRDYGGNVHYVPNGNISVVTNMSLGYAFAVVDASVAYGSDIDQVISVMREVGDSLRSDPTYETRIQNDIEIAGVEAWADSAIVVRCRFRVAPLEQWNVRREYLRRLKSAFDKAGIEIPYPHLKLVNADAR
ncbi:MAG: mechanosensitive ion channel family protein [Rhodocyclaceae bacterium]|jgi:small-conductance mechanosensitive channel|nr:MAG: mechanosensitive ion channel family protein [Rhodocyclaceae bacterium]